jgi:hypothetical protein
MRRSVIEARVLEIVERVTQGGRVEDDLVECKSQWLDDAYKAARRIAAQANSAQGESILWIIGLDEDANRLIGAREVDLAQWWPQVEKWFDEVTPELTSFMVPVVEGVSVCALAFRTDRAPYVVKTDGKGPIHREVPWRSGTSTRSAKRRELLRILLPAIALPEVELVSARTVATHALAQEENAVYEQIAEPERVTIEVTGELYFQCIQRVMLPAHKIVCKLSGLALDKPTSLDYTFALPSKWVTDRIIYEQPHTYGVDVKLGGIYLDGAGVLIFRAFGDLDISNKSVVQAASSLKFDMSFGVGIDSGRVVASANMEHVAGSDSGPNRQMGAWKSASDIYERS